MSIRNSSKSSLFLIELIIAILFFAIGSAVCVRAFVKAHDLSMRAKDLSFASAQASSAASVLEYTDGSFSSFSTYFPDAEERGDAFLVYYDADQSLCSGNDAIYTMQIKISDEDGMRHAMISVAYTGKEPLYELPIRFVPSAKKEVADDAARRKSFLSTGTTSIVLIFVLLCLLTFAVLSVVSARADYKLSEKNTTRTTEYYEAENTANDILLKISTVLSRHAGSSAYLDNVRTDLDGTDGISFSSASQLQYHVTINENQRLFVSLLLTNAASDTSSDTAGLYQIKAWKVENTHEWNNDTPVPVLDSDEMNELLSEE